MLAVDGLAELLQRAAWQQSINCLTMAKEYSIVHQLYKWRQVCVFDLKGFGRHIDICIREHSHP